MYAFYDESCLIVESADVLRIDDDSTIDRAIDDIAVREGGCCVIHVFCVKAITVAHVDDVGRLVGGDEDESSLCAESYPACLILGDARNAVGGQSVFCCQLVGYLVCLEVVDIRTTAVGGNP